ncbi:MAG: MmcQ/YjbR family DNA-binding protein [Ferruginibacter sp.]
MISPATFREMALSLPGATEHPHFEKAAFKTKKIFATLDATGTLGCLMLSLIDQSVFCKVDASVIYPVPNQWGQQGATYFELKKLRKSIVKDALQQAYENSLGKK